MVFSEQQHEVLLLEIIHKFQVMLPAHPRIMCHVHRAHPHFVCCVSGLARSPRATGPPRRSRSKGEPNLCHARSVSYRGMRSSVVLHGASVSQAKPFYEAFLPLLPSLAMANPQLLIQVNSSFPCKMLPRDDSLIPFTTASPFFVSLQGELGLPGPPGLDGEKVRGAWPDQVKPEVSLKELS